MIIPSPITGKKPRISPKAFIAPNATIIGDVTIEAGANIWYGAVLRGDNCRIHVGKNTSIQDNCVLHSEHDTECIVKDHVIVGHTAMIHGPCIVDRCTLIGINSIILQGSKVGTGAIVAGGATARKEIPALTLVVGTPAKPKKELPESKIAENEAAAIAYVKNAKKFLDAGQNHPGLEQFLDDSL
ncbi:MAG: gamma carbonic anhydrase family protein [Promethearchaeota archaeon]